MSCETVRILAVKCYVEFQVANPFPDWCWKLIDYVQTACTYT